MAACILLCETCVMCSYDDALCSVIYMYCPAWQMSLSNVQSSSCAAKQIKTIIIFFTPGSIDPRG